MPEARAVHVFNMITKTAVKKQPQPTKINATTTRYVAQRRRNKK
jgi:hypothetical protein